MRSSVPLTDFSGGEISPVLTGRSDWQGYAKSLQTLENWVPYSTGPVTTRPGSKYLGLTKSGAAAVIVCFQVSDGEAYLLEFTASLLRIWHDDILMTAAFAVATSEHATSYTTIAMCRALKFTQDGTKLYVTHKSVAPSVITFDGTYFDINTLTIVGNAGQLPFASSGNYPGYCAAFAQRLWFFGSTNEPQAGWCSKSGIYTDGYSWVAVTPYEIGEICKNDTAPVKLYRCITKGISAGSGGPTGTTADITDGTAHWAYWCAYGNIDMTYFDTVQYTTRVMDDVSTWAPPGDIPEFTDTTSYKDVVGDSSAMRFTLASDQNDNITGAIAGDSLVVGTVTSEYVISPDVTALNIGEKCKLQTRYGMETVQGFLLNDSMIFLQGYATRLREYKYDAAGQAFQSPDLTFQASHIMGAGGAIDMDLALVPEPMVYLVRTDGQLAVLLLNRAVGVTAWHRYVTGGSNTYESVAVTGGSAGDAVYAVVNRGTGYRCIEKFDAIGDMTSIPLDSWVDVTTSGATLTGLERMANDTATIWNVTHSTTTTGTVSAGGVLTIPAAHQGDHIVVGFGFTCTGKTTKLTTANTLGTGQMKIRSIAELYARVLTCYPFKVGYNLSYMETVPITGPATEDVQCPFVGNWDTDTFILFVQDAPYHSTILGFVAEVET